MRTRLHGRFAGPLVCCDLHLHSVYRLTAPYAEPLEWPGLDSAYEFVRPSYEMVLRRVDVAETRARASVGFAGTLMFAAPAFVVATLGPGLRSFSSPWFIAGAVAFVAVYVCVVAQQIPQLVGEIKVITPRGLATDEWLKA